MGLTIICVVGPTNNTDLGGSLAFSSESPFDLGRLIDDVQDVVDYTMDAPILLNTNMTVKKKKEEQLLPVVSSKSVTLTRPNSTSSYDPARKPLFVISKHKTNKVAVDVHLILDVSSTPSVGPVAKFLLDGLDRSPYTNVVEVTFLNPDMQRVAVAKRTVNPLVWMVDWGSMLRDCHRLQRVLEKLKRQPQDYVVLADFSASLRQSRCDHLFPDDPKVRLVKRSIVENRHYDAAKGVIHQGHIAPNSGSGSPGGLVQTTSLVVRERFVAAMLNITENKSPLKVSRDIDICFLWRPGANAHYGFWRRDVSRYLKKFGAASKYTTLVDVIADDYNGMNAGNLQLHYIKTLLRCKIVVVAQRDEWADHYRLYESLASGALVFTDPMLAPPPGLKNKTNIVVYDDLKSLGESIHYFLEHKDRRRSVAKRGMELALGRYRSWHRVEELLFGSPKTHVGDNVLALPPPKKVRAELSIVDGDTVAYT